jgi:hypothetical protein
MQSRVAGLLPAGRATMAKGQMKKTKETRKPKKAKPAKTNASQPSQKSGVVAGLDNMKK